MVDLNGGVWMFLWWTWTTSQFVSWNMQVCPTPPVPFDQHKIICTNQIQSFRLTGRSTLNSHRKSIHTVHEATYKPQPSKQNPDIKVGQIQQRHLSCIHMQLQCQIRPPPLWVRNKSHGWCTPQANNVCYTLGPATTNTFRTALIRCLLICGSVIDKYKVEGSHVCKH